MTKVSNKIEKSIIGDLIKELGRELNITDYALAKSLFYSALMSGRVKSVVFDSAKSLTEDPLFLEISSKIWSTV